MGRVCLTTNGTGCSRVCFFCVRALFLTYRDSFKTLARAALHQRNWTVAERAVHLSSPAGQDAEHTYLGLSVRMMKAQYQLAGEQPAIAAGVNSLLDIVSIVSKELPQAVRGRPGRPR